MATTLTTAKVPPPPPPVHLLPPVPCWTQREEDLERILALLRGGLPVDRAFDEGAAVFDDEAHPAEDDIPALGGRFRETAEALGQLAVLAHVMGEKRSETATPCPA
ncbi:hypothetical protein [Streptomyces sp. SID5910]|uniref:hypothetical protein n=1 Tax=Streptomyces sp. SID5910 TaxID=2690312 RepID=UPI001371F4C6|nr:hypothetical protein [Streptomyces sp. SID5910]MYR41087.1 hypothetical protein [Streptomyces sp. SID5910]